MRVFEPSVWVGLGGWVLGIVVKEGGLGNCKAGVVGNGGGVDVKYAERRTSETQLIKYVPGSTDK